MRKAAAQSLPTPHFRRAGAASGTPGSRPRPPTPVAHPERVGRLRDVGRRRVRAPPRALPPQRRSLTPCLGEGLCRRRAGGPRGDGPWRTPEYRPARGPSGVPGRPALRAEGAPRPGRAPRLPRPFCGRCSAGATGACPRLGPPRVRLGSAGAAASKLRPSGPAAAKWAAPSAPRPRGAVAAPALRSAAHRVCPHARPLRPVGGRPSSSPLPLLLGCRVARGSGAAAQHGKPPPAPAAH